MSLHEISTIVSLVLTGVVGIAGGLHFCCSRLLLRAYPTLEFELTSCRVMGALRILSALFLALPQTRVWGASLVALIAFVAVIAQLNAARYMWAIPGIVALTMLPVTMASGPLS